MEHETAGAAQEHRPQPGVAAGADDGEVVGAPDDLFRNLMAGVAPGCAAFDGESLLLQRCRDGVGHLAGLLTVVAWFAILFTGRYPRSIFDFNVGVMRWTWRVQFYAFGAFATDRYPPFSLGPDPGYPADLAVDYPEHLSRGLALVKWWLLAIPHYLVLAILTGGFAFGWGRGNLRLAGGGGLIGLLALIGVVVMAVSARYPGGLFDFVMGLNRWVWRVAAYAGLMRDEYPPFRLDAGGNDPGNPVPAPPPVPAGTGGARR